MKKIFFILSILISGIAYGQTTGFFRYDTVTFQKVGANSEFNLLNSTRGVTGGVLTNMGNGRTRFVTPTGGTVTSLGSGFKIGVNNTNNVKSILPSNGLTGDSLTAGQVGVKLGQSIGEAGNPAAFTGGSGVDREIPMGDSYLHFNNKTGTYGVLNPSSIVIKPINDPEIIFISKHGGSVNSYITDPSVDVFPGYSYYTGSYGSGTLQSYSGLHWIAAGNKHYDLVDLRGSLTSAQIQAGGAGIAVFNTDGSACLGCNGATKRIRIGDMTASGQTLGVSGSLSATDSVILTRKIASASTADSVLVVDANGLVKHRAQSDISGGGGGSVSISALTAAAASNSIDNVAHNQHWSWNSLTSGTGLSLSANTTGAASNTQQVLAVATSGANSNASQTTFGATFSNTHTGTGSTNVAGSFTAQSGTNNFAIRLIDGTEGNGKVLTSDASGNASWATPSGGGITVGTTTITSGTSTRIPFNDAGVYGEDAGLTYNKTTDALAVVGPANIQTLRVGLGLGSVATNTAVGFQALNTNTSGSLNTAFGYRTLDQNTTGYYNTAIGHAASLLNQGGALNTAVGESALYSNLAGNSNVAVGVGALQDNLNNYNVAVGASSLRFNTNGYFNMSLGGNAMYNNLTGINNAAVGYEALYDNTTGSNNIAIGYNTGKGITTGGGNVIIGPNITGLSSSLANNIIIANGAAIKLRHNGTDWTVTDPINTPTLATPVFTGNPTGTVTSGTYTPTLTNVANVSASTAYACQYMRVGSTVTVSGMLEMTVTAGGPLNTEVGISLPVASAIALDQQCGGTGASPSNTEAYAIKADPTNDRARIQTAPAASGNRIVHFHFTYQIL